METVESPQTRGLTIDQTRQRRSERAAPTKAPKPVDAYEGQLQQPTIAIVGTYFVANPTEKTNKDGVTCTVAPGEYPVMGVVSGDGARIEAAGVVFHAPDPRHQNEQISVYERIRPLDVPALVQSQRMMLAREEDGSRRVHFPLAMFLGTPLDAVASQKPESREKDQSLEQSQGPRI